MPDPFSFSVEVFRTVCDRFRSKAADLVQLVETGSSFEEWLVWEAFLACKLQEEGHPFCEVVAKPSYASEGVANDNVGDLRVGGPNDGADHCWLFAEFVLLNDDFVGRCLKKIETDVEKLKQLEWKKSAALLFVVAASRDKMRTEWTDDLAVNAMWNRPALTEPCVIPLLGGGSVVVKAFDIKQNLADTLTVGNP